MCVRVCEYMSTCVNVRFGEVNMCMSAFVYGNKCVKLYEYNEVNAYMSAFMNRIECVDECIECV